MKHQYFADHRDLLKYELLLDLAECSNPRRLLSILMLTPNDGTAEGSKEKYKQDRRRGALFAFLKNCLESDDRDVSRLRRFMKESGVDYQPHRDDDYFTDALRSEYFREAANAARNHSLIFFDPDIGLQSGAAGYMRRRGIDKYLMLADIKVVANAASHDAVFVVYQHLQKNKRLVDDDIRARCRSLSEAVGSSSTSFVTDRDVAFLVASRSNVTVGQVVAEHGDKHGLLWDVVPV